MQNSYTRPGGTAGSGPQLTQRPKTAIRDRDRFVAVLAVHLTTQSNVPFEGTSIWLADHHVETLARR